jgi:hypothetical protein
MYHLNNFYSRSVSFKTGRMVFAFEGQQAMEQELRATNERIEKLEITDFDKISSQVDTQLTDFIGATLRKLNDAHDLARAAEQADIEATKPGSKERKDKEKKQKENEELRLKQYKALQDALNKAKEAVMAALRTRVEEAKKKKEANAKRFGESLHAQLAAAHQETLKPDAKTKVGEMLKTGKMTYAPTAMPIVLKLEGGQTESKTSNWTGGDVETAVVQMLMVVYMEQSPEEAQNRANALIESAKKQAGGKVNYFALDEAFGAGGRGSFRYTIEHGICRADRGAEITGLVMGYMYSANEIFKGPNSKYFAAYEAYLKRAVEQETMGALLSPTDWARKNAPEALTEEKAASQIIDDILAMIPEPKEKPEEVQKTKARIRMVLETVAASAPKGDPVKLDAMLRQALVQMGATSDGKSFDTTKITALQPQKIEEGREMYGNSRRMLDDETKLQISALILAAETRFGGQRILDEKGQPVDFVAWYKEQVNGLLKSRGDVHPLLEEARDTRDDELRAARLVSIVEAYWKKDKDRIVAKFHSAVAKIIADNIPSPAKLYDGSKKPEVKEKPAEVPEKPAAPVNVATAKPAAGPAATPTKAPASAPAAAPTAVAAGPKVQPKAGAETQTEITPAQRFSKLSAEEQRALGGEALRIGQIGVDNIARNIERKLADGKYSKIKAGEEYLTPAGVRVKISREEGVAKVEVTGMTAKARAKLPQGQPAEKIASIDSDGLDVAA